VDLVVPELQRRALARSDYEGTTLREHYFGAGARRLADDHPGTAHRLAAGGEERKAVLV